MRRSFLIRHAATGPSTEGRFYGSTDLSLSEDGVRQARLLAERLSSEEIKAVFSSPLKRALETAMPIALAHDLQVNVLDGLREIDFGAWEGMSFDEIRKRYPGECNSWLADPWNFTFPRGESTREFKKRVSREFAAVLNSEGPAAVVSHGGPLRVILSCLGCIEESRAFNHSLDHGGITIIESGGSGWKIKAMNDTAHLF